MLSGCNKIQASYLFGSESESVGLVDDIAISSSTETGVAVGECRQPVVATLFVDA